MNEPLLTKPFSTLTENCRGKQLKGIIMVLTGAILWGLSGTAAQVLFQQYGYQPGWLVVVRMGVSGLLLLLGTATAAGVSHVIAVWQKPRDALRLLLFAFLGLVGVQYTYFAAIQAGDAATATLLQYLGPVLITLYLALRNRRLPLPREWLSLFLAMAGTFLLVTNGRWNQLSVTPAALFWGIASAFALAFYTLYPQNLVRAYGSAAVVGWAMLIGSAGAALFAPPWSFSGMRSGMAVFLIAFVVFFGTLLAFYFYLASLRFLSPEKAGLTACAEPLSATVAATVFLHVPMSAWAWGGAVCIMFTVLLLSLPKRKGNEP